jgi:DNA-binding IclR family transcriptional regulator
VKNRPAYGIDSVDHALHLAMLLVTEGPLGVTDAARRLGVARSTAHRLLAMLVYREFAEQDADRRYSAGPMLRPATPDEPSARLRRLVLPHLRALTEQVGETTNLMVLEADRARFVVTVECDRVLRVGDREGRTLPAHLASGSKALLAGRPPLEVATLYADRLPAAELAALQRELVRVRRRGFAVNDRRTEAGVTAIGRAVAGTGAAVSIALPTARFRRDLIPGWAAALTAATDRIERELGHNDDLAVRSNG